MPIKTWIVPLGCVFLLRINLNYFPPHFEYKVSRVPLFICVFFHCFCLKIFQLEACTSCQELCEATVKCIADGLCSGAIKTEFTDS